MNPLPMKVFAPRSLKKWLNAEPINPIFYCWAIRSDICLANTFRGDHSNVKYRLNSPAKIKLKDNEKISRNSIAFVSLSMIKQGASNSQKDH